MLAIAAEAQPNPDTLWTEYYCEGAWNECNGHAVHVYADASFLVLSSYSAGEWGGSSLRFLRFDSSGQVLWSQPNETVQWGTIARSLGETPDGGFVVGGGTYSYTGEDGNIAVMKVDSTGSEEWVRFYGDTTAREYASYVLPTSDGGYLIAGSVYNPESVMCVLKVDSGGSVIWNREFDFSPIQDHATAAVEIADGYVVSGYVGPYPYFDAILLKLNLAGELLWSQTYGDEGYTTAEALQSMPDGSLIFCGEKDFHFYLVKVDGEGNESWERTDSDSSDWAAAYSLAATPDGGYVLNGICIRPDTPYSDMMLAKADSAGNFLWTRYYGNAGDDRGTAIGMTADQSYVLIGQGRSPANGMRELYVARTGPDMPERTEERPPSPADFWLRAYPNPFNPTTTASFSLPHTQQAELAVYDLTGRRVKTLINETLPAGEHQVAFDGSGLPAGIYFARLKAGMQQVTQKIVLLK